MKKFFARLFVVIFIIVLSIGTIISSADTNEECNVYVNLSTREVTTYSDEESSVIVPWLLANTDFSNEEYVIDREEANSFIQPSIENQISLMSTTPMTITGANQANSPYSQICQIKITYTNGTNGYATGFFVAPNAVATAAHLFNDPYSRVIKSADICYSYKDSSVAKYAYTTATAFYYRSFSGLDYIPQIENDYALILIGNSAGSKCGYFKLSTVVAPNLNDIYTLAGFSGNTATASRNSADPMQLSSGCLDSVLDKRITYSNFYIDNGLSGGPLFRSFNGYWQSIGIISSEYLGTYQAARLTWDVYKNYNSYANFHSLSMYRCSESTKVANVKSLQTYINNNLPMQYLGTKLDVDGGFGPLTKTATIKLIQYWLNTSYNAGLAVDGGFGSLTTAAFRTIKKGQSGMPVYILQGALYGNYYDPNGFDGSFGVNGGTGCLNAVKYAQADKGLSSINGEATAALVKSLCS